MKHFIAFFTLGMLLNGIVDAQETSTGVVSGNMSVLFQSYQEDSIIGRSFLPQNQGLMLIPILFTLKGISLPDSVTNPI